MTKFPLHDLDGKIYAIGGIVTDITERRRLEAEVLKISDREQRRPFTPVELARLLRKIFQ